MKKKLSDSRIIRLALIGLLILFGIKLISYGMIAWIVHIIDAESSDSLKIDAYIRLVQMLTVPVSGSAATIIAAVAARYGARETMSSYRGNTGVSGEELK